MNSSTSSSSLKTGATTLSSVGVRGVVSDIVSGARALLAGAALESQSSCSGLSHPSIYRSSCLRMGPEGNRPRASARATGLLERLRAPMLLQFVKFGIVGVSNTLLTFVVYTLLLKVFGVWYLAASAVG